MRLPPRYPLSSLRLDVCSPAPLLRTIQSNFNLPGAYPSIAPLELEHHRQQPTYWLLTISTRPTQVGANEKGKVSLLSKIYKPIYSIRSYVKEKVRPRSMLAYNVIKYGTIASLVLLLYVIFI
jgi:hypothetical protein